MFYSKILPINASSVLYLFKLYDAKSKTKFWIAPNDLRPETKKKPSAKRLSNKVNRKKLKKEADEPNPKG